MTKAWARRRPSWVCQSDGSVHLTLGAVGWEETRTLRRLRRAESPDRCFGTTNMLEPVLAQVKQRTGKVDRWTNSDQKYRWFATALLDIEPRMRRLHRDCSLLSSAWPFNDDDEGSGFSGDGMSGKDAPAISTGPGTVNEF
jgi:hypothetical protein